MANGQVLYLVRHGIAAERGDDYPDDAQRPLIPEGRVRLKQIAVGLRRLGVAWDEVLTSPLVRALQTAQALSEAFDPRPPVTTTDSLALGGRTDAVFAELARRRSLKSVALVGHMPGMGILAAQLIGASRELEFKKGAVACIELERGPAAGAGRLLWFASPKLLRSDREK